MGVSWTKEQQQVIDLRDRDILVSAAAGSGKTAVLVERIIAMVSDETHPVDIDHLLIVTFTNAAAGEMKERIRAAIEKSLEADSDNEHLERQLTLVHHAQITTIHSFCQYVIRNYFHLIDLDPSFRIGDEGEIKLLKNDVVEDLIEDYYDQGERDYLNFVECYAPGKSDYEIGALILQLYEFSMSSPWPLKWLEECKSLYAIDNTADLCLAPWMADLLSQVKLLLQDCLERTYDALEIALKPDGPYMYEEALREDEKLLESLLSSADYLEYGERFAAMGRFAVLSRKKDEAVSDEKRELVKTIRDQMKKALKGIKEQYFYETPEKLAEDMKKCRSQIGVLTELAAEFSVRYARKKREKNLLDFNDLEHLALAILVSEEDGKPVPSAAAIQLSEQIEEVMIDEYQDSNLVQEYILTSVSRQHRGEHNVFMVGDVKQSIYRFRLARPELFMEKYDTYPPDGEKKQKIELHKNFRSRSQVLDSVNFIFKQIMKKDLGNVEYDDAAALYTGASFPEGKTAEENTAEVILFDLDAEAETVEETGETAIELEARLIGRRILKAVGREQVLDKQTGAYRPARFSDIVILLRTVSKWADVFSSVLGEMGIPAYSGSQTGYFSAVEVQTVLALLKVIDNPRNDIPLAAVLRSPICGLGDEELAMIKSEYPEGTFEAACRRYQDGEHNLGIPKLDHFFEMLEAFRRLVPYTTMHELLWHIFEETGYADYVEAMPGGERRAANLDMLVEKAMAYESTSYRGLFNFIRYIEQLKRYEVDYGEASVLGEEEDTVRIMSIHKSKGLEFPIVFVSGLHKKFNQQDSRSKLVLHPDLGIGCDCIDPIMRVKSPTLLKKLIRRRTIYENLGEELRVLYVALTRAKEKLIMTGVVTGLEDKKEKWRQRLSFGSRSTAGSYLDWIMPALSGEKQELFKQEICSVGDLAMAETTRQLTGLLKKEQLLEWETGVTYDETAKAQLEEAFSYRYAWEDSAEIYGKITVSELKTLQQQADAEDEYAMYQEPQIVPLIPNFIKEREVTGAALGTIYHQFLECLDFCMEPTKDTVVMQLEKLTKEGKLQGDEARQIDIGKILTFLRSDLGIRMKRAQANNELYKEQQFIIGMPAEQIREKWKSDDMVLIQGIIDAWFYEDGSIILVDYKTDYVPGRAEDFLIKKYGVQLKYYADALERMTGKQVKEQTIYSFWLQKELRNM